MLRPLRQFAALPARERRLLLLLAMLQPGVSLALRLVGFQRTRRWLERHSRHQSPHPASASEVVFAERIAELAAIAGRRGPISTTCLRQALAVHWLLRRHGLQPIVRFGVDRIGASPDMHAWVELEGIPLAQPQLRHRAFQPAASASTASTTSSNVS